MVRQQWRIKELITRHLPRRNALQYVKKESWKNRAHKRSARPTMPATLKRKSWENRHCDKIDNDERSIKTALPRSFNCCLFFIRVRGGTGVCPSCPRMESRNIPWTVSKHRTNLVTPVDLACMILEGGRKLEYLAQTYRCTGRT